jgi:hypothetical protein
MTAGEARLRRERAVVLGAVALAAAVVLVVGDRVAALGLVALAGAAAALLVRRRARVALSLALVAVAVAVVLAGPGWAATTGGVLLGLAALAMAVSSRRWPEPRREFGRGQVRRAARTREGTAALAGGRDTWDALDRGEDPTA